MSQILEIPDELYSALKEAADSSNTTPQGWIAANLPDSEKVEPKTLADLFAGRVGRIRSGSEKALSENCGATFTEHLETKRQGGLL